MQVVTAVYHIRFFGLDDLVTSMWLIISMDFKHYKLSKKNLKVARETIQQWTALVNKVKLVYGFLLCIKK